MTVVGPGEERRSRGGEREGGGARGKRFLQTVDGGRVIATGLSEGQGFCPGWSYAIVGAAIAAYLFAVGGNRKDKLVRAWGQMVMASGRGWSFLGRGKQWRRSEGEREGEREEGGGGTWETRGKKRERARERMGTPDGGWGTGRC